MSRLARRVFLTLTFDACADHKNRLVVRVDHLEDGVEGTALEMNLPATFKVLVSEDVAIVCDTSPDIHIAEYERSLIVVQVQLSRWLEVSLVVAPNRAVLAVGPGLQLDLGANCTLVLLAIEKLKFLSTQPRRVKLERKELGARTG